MKFKLHSIDSGFCRIFYTTRNEHNERLIYCLQDDGRNMGVSLYRCSQDGEPSYKVKFKFDLKDNFEAPKGDTELEQNCKRYIENN